MPPTAGSQFVDGDAEFAINGDTMSTPTNFIPEIALDDDQTAVPTETDDAEAYSMLMSYPEEPDYYAILGLRRDPPPTDAAIRSAYRNLTLSFHPDKQPAESREAAELQFERIREAYDTLLDPKKRVVYDLLGAEGVRNEWGLGGSMGRGGEAEKQVGVRAQKPEEFRKWFLDLMKKRERKMVNSMVQSRGSLSLGIDASNTISVDAEAGEVYVHVPSPKPSSFAIGYSFRAPFPTLRTIFGQEEKEDEEEEEEEEEEGVDAQKSNQHLEETEGAEMSIQAAISGPFQRLFQDVELQHMDGTKEHRKLPLPLILSTQNMSLGASVTQVFADVPSTKGILSKWPFTFLRYSGLTVTGTLLPSPTLQTNIVKNFAPIEGTKPFKVVFGTTFNRSIFQSLPVLGLQVTKQIGERKHAFCNWSSGIITWPIVVQELMRPFVGLGLDVENALTATNELSQFQFGILSQPRRSRYTVAMDDDEDEGFESDDDAESTEYRRIRAKQRAEDKAAEAWQVGLSSSPVSNGLSCTYSRNIFSGKSVDEAVRSEWSSEKHYPLPPAKEHRSVRVEVTGTVSVDLSLAWSIEGSRPVGDLTRMAVGVGVQGARGLVMTVSWSRLGQRIKLPIAVCPLEAVNADAAALAVLFPWVAYCAMEFGFVRPQERRNRRKVMARRQKQLKKLIPQRKAESTQAIQLMTEQVRRRQAREERDDGLVVTKAEYGYYPLKRKEAKEPEVTDVTIAVAALVDRGQLVIPKETVKFHIIGFHDPAPLLPKKLKIWYQYHGKEHYVEASDVEGIACPMRLHLVD